MTRMDAGGGLAVTTRLDIAEPLSKLMDQDAPNKLAAKDTALWGAGTADDAENRLGWIDTFSKSRALIPTLDALRARLAQDGLTHVVLAGMGGSSLAPEVICRTLDVPLTVLDTTDADQIREALADSLSTSVVVVSSKSGGTVETESLRRVYAQAFTDAGIKNVGKHFVVVTDSGSPLEQLGTAMNATVICADPDVGGRYSALTAFGLVPAALAGVDVAELLDDAETFATTIAAQAPDNPALLLGAALAQRPTISLASDGTGIVGLGDWIEQLIAESTGKDGTGVLPVVIESIDAPGANGPSVLAAQFGGPKTANNNTGVYLAPPDVTVNGGLGAQFLCWELATAYAGNLLNINPFDQPNVAESKNNTNSILDSPPKAVEPSFSHGAVTAYGTPASTFTEALSQLVSAEPTDGYLAIMAYLNKVSDSHLAQLRSILADYFTVPVTFGWGPRFLHSTGQFHKGGRPTGAFLQITADPATDLEVPGRPFSFATLQAAQALGDRRALQSRDRPLLHLQLSNRRAGIDQLLAAAKELSAS